MLRHKGSSTYGLWRWASAIVLCTVLLLGLGTPSSLLAQGWKQGQPPELANSTLAPHPQPPAPTPAKDIPIDKIKLPPGFSIEVWADMIPNARAMTLGSKGTLFVSSRGAGNVYALVDKDGKRDVKVIAKGLKQPNGVVFKDGDLYVAEISHRVPPAPLRT